MDQPFASTVHSLQRHSQLDSSVNSTFFFDVFNTVGFGKCYKVFALTVSSQSDSVAALAVSFCVICYHSESLSCRGAVFM
jgi:hypothetical protein